MSTVRMNLLFVICLLKNIDVYSLYPMEQCYIQTSLLTICEHSHGHISSHCRRRNITWQKGSPQQIHDIYTCSVKKIFKYTTVSPSLAHHYLQNLFEYA